jgi:CheY-like chemotaxis protein
MKRVMIVEDDELVQKLVAALIQRLGADPFVVDNLEKVERAIGEIETMSVAIVDLILPFETGWDIIDRIRKAGEEGAALPVIVFTGAVLSDHENERLLKKANAIIRKNDFNVDEFTDLLNQWI